MDYAKIKDYHNWGMNRALSDLRLRRMVDVKVRETLSKKKPERDWQRLMVLIIIMALGGAVAFTIVTQFFNYSDISAKFASCVYESTIKGAELEVCRKTNVAAEAVSKLIG